MSAVVGWTNIVKTSTVTASSAALSAENLKTDSGSAAEAWQTAATVVTGVTVTVTPASATVWRAFGVFRTNLTSSATVTFTLKNTGPTTVATVTVSPVSGYGQAVAVLSANTTADYLEVAISDAGNPDGFLNVPLMFAGPAWLPARSIGYSSTVGRDVSRGDVITRGGQEYPALNFRRRRWNIAFESLLTSEVWGTVDDMLVTADTGSNVFFLPDTASSYIQREAIFGRLAAIADVSFPYQSADRRRWAAQVTERL